MLLAAVTIGQHRSYGEARRPSFARGNGPPKIRGTSTLYKPHAAHAKNAWDHCSRQSRKVLTYHPVWAASVVLCQLRRGLHAGLRPNPTAAAQCGYSGGETGSATPSVCRQSQPRADDANANQQYAEDSTSQRRVALLRRSHHPVRNRANHSGRVLKRTTCQCSGAARTSRGSTKAEPYLWRDSAPSLAVQGFFHLQTLCTLLFLFVEEVNQFYPSTRRRLVRHVVDVAV